MTHDEVIDGLETLQASDFDYNNRDARGWEKLRELRDALELLPSPERAIPALFAIMERLPDADLGSPGPLVHTLELFCARWRRSGLPDGLRALQRPSGRD